MQFNPVGRLASGRSLPPRSFPQRISDMVEAGRGAAAEESPTGAPAPTLEALPSQPAAAPAPTPGPPPAQGRQALVEASQNLLKHIPGEASGFYLLAADSIDKPRLGTLALIFVLAIVLLVTVRWLANASRGIMVTTILAFLLWMLIFDKGFLHVAFPYLLPPPLGLIVAVFYSMLITLLASAGKIR